MANIPSVTTKDHIGISSSVHQNCATMKLPHQLAKIKGCDQRLWPLASLQSCTPKLQNKGKLLKLCAATCEPSRVMIGVTTVSQLIKTVWQCSDQLGKIKGYDLGYNQPPEPHSTILSPSWSGENFMSLYVCRWNLCLLKVILNGF